MTFFGTAIRQNNSDYYIINNRLTTILHQILCVLHSLRGEKNRFFFSEQILVKSSQTPEVCFSIPREVLKRKCTKFVAYTLS